MSDSDPATFHQQALLQDRLTDLSDLIRDIDGQAVSQELQDLILRAFGEIESWLNRGEEPMSFEAQMTLSNMANGPTTGKNNIGNQFSYNEFIQSTPPILLTPLELERKIFSSPLLLFTPKCGQQLCSLERKSANVFESTL